MPGSQTAKRSHGLSLRQPGDIAQANQEENRMAEFDIVIHGGRLIDGTGNPWFYGDVAIKDGKIAAIGKIKPEAGQRGISAKGYVVTPGYIDMHTHSDQPLVADG